MVYVDWVPHLHFKMSSCGKPNKVHAGIGCRAFSSLILLLASPAPGPFLAKNSAEKTKYIDVSQPPHQGDELNRR